MDADAAPTRTAVGRAARPGGWATEAVLLLLCFTVSLLAYLRTMRPSFGWGDSSELITAAYHLGIAHSPGYPTWVLIAHPFAHLPLGEAATRVNVMNAVLGAGAVALAYRLYQMISRCRAGALVAALALAFSTTFWRVTAETDVWTLHMLLSTGLLVIALRWRRTRENHWLYLLSCLLGLGLGNHALTALMIPPLLYLVWAERGARFLWNRRTVSCLALFALGLGVYALLPIRGPADPPPYPRNPHTLAEAWDIVTARNARDSMFDSGVVLPARRALKHVVGLSDEFGYAGCALGLLGLGLLWRRDRRLTAFLALFALLDVGFAANFSIVDAYVYYLPLYLAWGCLLAEGAAAALWAGGRIVAWASEGRREADLAWGRAVAAALLMALPFALFADHLRTVDLSDRRDAEHLARAVFRQVDRGALVMADWWTIGPLWYLRHVEGERPDLTLSPAPSLSGDARFRAFATRERLAQYPAVYFVEELTDREEMLRQLGFLLVPQGPVNRVLVEKPEPSALLASLPPAPVAGFGDEVGLAQSETGGAELRPDRSLPVTLNWIPLARYRPRPYRVILMLANPQGERVWQETASLGHGLYSLDRWEAGQVLTERRWVYLQEPAQPGVYDLLVRVRVKGEPRALTCDQAVDQRNRDYRVARVVVGEAGPAGSKGEPRASR